MATYKYDATTGTYILVDDTMATHMSVSTDLADYAPGSTAYFTANVGFGDTVTFNVTDVAGTAVSGTNQPWTVTDGGAGDLDGVVNGVIQTSWAVGQDAAGEAFTLTATDQTVGLMTTASFTDSAGAHGVLLAPKDPSNPADTATGAAYNPTHWAVLDGATISDTIVGASDAVVVNGTVQVEIKSSTHGNTFVTGTFDADGADNIVGTADDNSINFSWTVQSPDGSDICETTVVAYQTGVTGGGAAQFSNVNNSGRIGLAIVNADGTAHECDDDTGGDKFASMSLDKQVACDADGSDGKDLLNILAGKEITYVFKIANTGDVDINKVELVDATLGLDQIFAAGGNISGDTNNDGILGVGETWTVLLDGGQAAAGLHENVASVSGAATDVIGGVPTPTTTSSQDFADYFGLNPHVTIDKVTTVGSVTGDNVQAFVGETVTWTYTVKNDGNVSFAATDVKVTDVNSANDTVTPVIDTVHSIGYADGSFDAGDVWVYTATGTAHQGGYTNTGTVTAPDVTDDCGNIAHVTASNDSSYTGVKESTTYTQGFWSNHTSAWDGTVNNEGKNAVIGEVNAGHSDGVYIGLGILPAADQFFVTMDAARQIEAGSGAGDPRIIMLAQLIAAQLNFQSGAPEPKGLIEDGVAWLKAYGGSLLTDGSLGSGDYSIDKKNGITLKGTAMTGDAWKSYVVTDHASDAWGDFNTLLAGNQVATGEGLKNALMWWNDGHLVTGGSLVAWDSDGTGPSAPFADTNQTNNLDEFWMTLHLADSLHGGLPGQGIHA